MNNKLAFIRLPLLLVVLFFVGRLVLGAMGQPYDAANRLFSMVTLQVHIALLWAAVGRAYQNYKLKDAVLAVVMVVFVSQALILLGTAGSYLTGTSTYFNFPTALNSDVPVVFAEAMVRRTITLIANCVFGGVIGAMGWGLGGLLPQRKY